MVDVVLRKTRNTNLEKEFALEIRNFGSGVDVDWMTLCYVDYYTAHQLQGKTIEYWIIDPEQTPDSKKLRNDTPALQKAWDQYQLLKTLAKESKC